MEDQLVDLWQQRECFNNILYNLLNQTDKEMSVTEISITVNVSGS